MINMQGVHFLLCLIILVSAPFFAFASDPNPCQDYCVAVNNTELFTDGKLCKDPQLAVASDFYFSGLDEPGNTENKFGFNVTLVNVDNLPGLDTLGVFFARLDNAPYGLNPPHTHPRATETFAVLEGTFLVGFLSLDPENRLFAEVLNTGDAFVLPVGPTYFQFNVGHDSAVAFTGAGTQNPGKITIANSLFESGPRINPGVLAKAFKVDKDVIGIFFKSSPGFYDSTSPKN